MLLKILTLTFGQYGPDCDLAVCQGGHPYRTARRGFVAGYRFTLILFAVAVTSIAMAQASAAIADSLSFESRSPVSTGVGPIRFRVAANKQNDGPATARAEPPVGITALGDGAWETISPPARVEGKGLRIEGVPSLPAAYGAVSVLYHLPKGALVAASINVKQGGIVLGLLDKAGQWATKVPIPPGVFWTTVQAPADGEYRIVVANNLPAAQTANDVEVTEIGLVALDPTALLVTPAAVPEKAQPEQPIEITALDDGAWLTLTPPARLIGQALKIDGTPSYPAAYGAVSAFYRLPKGALVAAAGTVTKGGIALGLQNKAEQWVATKAILPGAFRTAVQAPADGEYRIVVANNLPSGQTMNNVEVTEIGLVALDPAALRVTPAASDEKTQSEQPIEITALDEGAWLTLSPPARLDGKALKIDGTPSNPAAYGAVSAFYRLPKGALVAAAGTVTKGGIALGLQNKAEQWVATKAISPGAFRTAVQAPADGEYRIVVANNLPAGQTTNDAEVTKIGLVALDPATLRVASPASSEAQTSEAPFKITPLDDGAWAAVLPPARLDGSRLRIEGMPEALAAYAATSVLYRLPKATRVAVAGTVANGGIAFGLQDKEGRWVTTVAIPPGDFRKTVEAPADGEYRIVVANNLPVGQSENDAEVTEIGFVGLDPATVRVASDRKEEQ